MARIIKYRVVSNMSVLKHFFISGGYIYISEPIHRMNGIFDYECEVYDESQIYIGSIRKSEFEKLNLINDN